jgi:uncharacterized membrane protein YedE/YeeE
MILSWKTGGVLLGAVFFAAVLLVKPVGVSTQFVIFDGILWDAVNDAAVVESKEAKSGYASPNAYLNKSGGKYAKNVADPWNYSFVFVLAMMGGAAASALMRGGVPAGELTMPPVWRVNYGDAPWKRHLTAFGAGFIVLYGARLAGGCTSGHMMSGAMQTSLSAYIFMAGAFLAAIPLAIILYPKEA